MCYSVTIIKKKLGLDKDQELKQFIQSGFYNIPKPINIDKPVKEWKFNKDQFDEWNKRTIKQMAEVMDNFFILRSEE